MMGDVAQKGERTGAGALTKALVRRSCADDPPSLAGSGLGTGGAGDLREALLQEGVLRGVHREPHRVPVRLSRTSGIAHGCTVAKGRPRFAREVPELAWGLPGAPAW